MSYQSYCRQKNGGTQWDRCVGLCACVCMCVDDRDSSLFGFNWTDRHMCHLDTCCHASWPPPSRSDWLGKAKGVKKSCMGNQSQVGTGSAKCPACAKVWNQTSWLHCPHRLGDQVTCSTSADVWSSSMSLWLQLTHDENKQDYVLRAPWMYSLFCLMLMWNNLMYDLYLISGLQEKDFGRDAVHRTLTAAAAPPVMIDIFNIRSASALWQVQPEDGSCSIILAITAESQRTCLRDHRTFDCCQSSHTFLTEASENTNPSTLPAHLCLSVMSVWF